ncbi:MAG: stalk domain-containing protein [Mycobacterium leprae]
MRKIWIGITVAALLLTGAAAGATAESLRKSITVEYKGISIKVDGQQVAIPEEQAPFLYVDQGRTYVPARPLAEALGASVGWDGTTNTVQVYSQTYATSQVDGTDKIWSMPANQFSLRAPMSFFKLDMPVALLTLVQPGLNGNSVVAVQRMDPTGSTPDAKVSSVLTQYSLLLTGPTVDSTVPASGQVTARGSANFMGAPVHFTLRIISTDTADWVLLGTTPDGSGSSLDTILDSFTLTK